MQFQLLTALAATFRVVASAGKPTYAARCGEDSEIIKSTTIPYKNSEVVITTFACSGVANSTSTSATMTPSKRQTNECGVSCGLECEPWDVPIPIRADCADLGILIAETAGLFTTPSETYTTATYETCEALWANGLGGDFEYCFDDWGAFSAELAEDCIPSFPGGACVGPGPWVIEVFGRTL